MKINIRIFLGLYFMVFSILPIALFAQEQNATSEEAEGSVEKYPHKTLVQMAWDYYNAKKYDLALRYAQRCIASYDVRAKELQASLKGPIPEKEINRYWQLNDVATAKFIKGKILYFRNDPAAAREVFSDIAQNYKYAMTFDLHGWYWSVANAAKDMLKAMELGIDFGDSSSGFLTTKAWEAYNKHAYEAGLGYAEQCIKMYQDAALWQQKSLTRYPKKQDIVKYWALNDVGTCYYIAGMSSRKMGKRKEARIYFKYLKENLYFASCWDNKGWYWKVVDALKK